MTCKPLLSVLMVCAALAGCFGGGGGDEAPAPPAPPPVVSNEVPASATVSATAYSQYAGGLAASDTPQRITELRKWVREHREWRHKNVRTRANCVPCHADAERGQYDD